MLSSRYTPKHSQLFSGSFLKSPRNYPHSNSIGPTDTNCSNSGYLHSLVRNATQTEVSKFLQKRQFSWYKVFCCMKASQYCWVCC